MKLEQCIELRSLIAEDMAAIIAKFEATKKVDRIVIQQLRDHCFDARLRLPEKGTALSAAICTVAGAAGKCLADGNIGQLSDAVAKLDYVIEQKRRLLLKRREFGLAA